MMAFLQGSSLKVPNTAISLYRSTKLALRCASFQANYYQVLQVDSKATSEEIKLAYYSQSKLFHPDVNQDSDAASKFALISEAYTVLGNQQTRAEYDRGKL